MIPRPAVTTDPVDLSEEYRQMLDALAHVLALDEYSGRHGQQWRVFANVAGPPMSLPYYCEVGGKTFGGKTFGGKSYGEARAAAVAAIRALPEKGTL